MAALRRLLGMPPSGTGVTPPDEKAAREADLEDARRRVGLVELEAQLRVQLRSGPDRPARPEAGT